MYNQERLVYIKGVKVFCDSNEEEKILGVDITVEYRTRNVDDIIAFGFGEYGDYARYLITTCELPIEGKYKLRTQKYSSVLLKFPDCKHSIFCEVKEVTAVAPRDVDGTITVIPVIRAYTDNKEILGTICSRLKENVLLRMDLQQSDLFTSNSTTEKVKINNMDQIPVEQTE